MSILYEDSCLICFEDAMTIFWYYFPLGSKTIAYQNIRSIEEIRIDFWRGKLRIWGMGLSPYWFHLDVNRPAKDRCIIIDDGNWIKSAITPNDPDTVLQILRQKISF